MRRRKSRPGCRSRWRRHVGRAFRRQGRDGGILRADGAGGRAIRGAVCGRTRRGLARHAHARHIRHGDDACRGPSQSGALRSPADRRHLDERFRRHRRHPAPARHELPGTRRQ